MSFQAYYKVYSRYCLILLLFMFFSTLNLFHLPLFKIIKVNVTLLKQFLGLYCPSKLIIRLTHVVCLISLLFMFFSSLNQYHLPLFIINNVNVTLLRHFLRLYCLSKHIIRLSYDFTQYHYYLRSFLSRINFIYHCS